MRKNNNNLIERVSETIWLGTNETCKYISGYINKQSIVTVKCIIHDYVFDVKYERVRHKTQPFYVCPFCQEENKIRRHNDKTEELVCDYCGVKFVRLKSKTENSKSGLSFCCREHKDLSQRLDSGSLFDALRPDHYGTGGSYREHAFRAYKHKCACCGWDEDERILEVHHIDKNRENNDIDNLVILCPICHKKITLGYYTYDKQQKTLTKIK